MSQKRMKRKYGDMGTNKGVVLGKWGQKRKNSWDWDSKDQEVIENQRQRNEDIKEGLAFSKLSLDHTDEI